jgi:hypothetical protein
MLHLLAVLMLCAQAPKPVDPHYLVPPTVIPKTLTGILEKLRKDESAGQALLDGTSTEGPYPLFTRVRDLSVAIEAYLPRLAPARRARASLAVRETVRLAWIVHEAQDFGEPGQVRTGLQQLRAAIVELVAAFEAQSSSPGLQSRPVS